MTELVPLEYPKAFRGVFARRREVYAPLVEAARRDLHALALPDALRPFYDAVVRENPQPSFLLLPLMFLAAAEATGGVRDEHRRYLPVLLLCMETCAVVDDTVDRTPMRSGRRSFPMRFGETSAAPFVGSLVAVVAREAGRADPALQESTLALFLELYALQLWEHQHLYPRATLFDRWLENRYAENAAGIAFGLHPALRLAGLPPLPREVLERFGRVFQDVDDLVNLVEDRATVGENDDVLMGAVTRPLRLALEAHPALHGQLERVWGLARSLTGASARSVTVVPARAWDGVRAMYAPLRQAMLEVGVPGTVAAVLEDARRCVEATPSDLRPLMAEMVGTWVDRLRSCGGVDLLAGAADRRTA